MPAMLNRYARQAPPMGRLLTLLTATVLGGSTLTACHDGATAPDPYTPVATTIEITDPGLVRDGDVLGLTATVKDQRQRAMSGVAVQFAVTDPTVALVGPGNILTALREGTTELVAVAGSLQQRRPLVVVLHPATAIEVPQPTYALFINAQQRIPTIVRGLGDRILTGRPLTWQSSNTAVARVDDTGLVTAVGQGEATISVRYGTLVRNIPVQVAAYATLYRVANIDGRPLPTNVHEELITRDDGSQYTLIERLESGLMSAGPRYELTMTIADIERTELQGNTIERVIRRRTLRDEGLLWYNWLDASASLQSSLIGGLTHELRPDLNGPRVFFRIAGTNTIWGLGMQRQQ